MRTQFEGLRRSCEQSTHLRIRPKAWIIVLELANGLDIFEWIVMGWKFC
jgi:hypothetical protein